MDYYRIFCAVVMTITLTAFTATTSLAVSSSSPQKGSGELNGLKVKGDAAGTKLSGVMEISFSELECNEEFLDEDGVCVDPNGCQAIPNAAKARVALRLSMPNTKEESTKTFYVDLDYTDNLLDGDEPFLDYLTEGKVPYWEIGTVQDIILKQLRDDILAAFSVADDQQEIYLKDFSLYSQANLVPAKDSFPPDAKDCGPPSCADDPYNVGCMKSNYQVFTAVANIVLAVD